MVNTDIEAIRKNLEAQRRTDLLQHLAGIEHYFFGFENAITWGCSSVVEAYYLDKNYEQYMEIEELRAQRDEARQVYIEDECPSREFLEARGWPIPDDYRR